MRYEVRGPLREVVLCHCGLCRRWHGHFAAYTAAARDAVQVHDDDRLLSWYRSPGNQAGRGFCARCGSSLFWSRDDTSTVSIAAGTLDTPTGLKSTTHIFVDNQADYYQLDDALEKRSLSLS